MANVPYLTPGQSLTAAHWNDLWTEADARLFKLYSGLPPCLWGALLDSWDPGGPWGFERRFYFWSNELPIGPASSAAEYGSYKTIAQAFFGKVSNGTILTRGSDPWVRQYFSAPFGDLVALLDLDDPDFLNTGPHPVNRPAKDADYKVARLRHTTLMEFAAFDESIWGLSPSGFDVDNALHYSLETHSKNFDGVSYYVYQANVVPNTEAEYRHKWIPIDVFIGETFNADNPLEWPIEFNKYQLIRFQNLQETEAAVHIEHTDDDGNLIFTTLTIPALSTKCVRRTQTTASNGSDLVTYETSPLNYFHIMKPGDPWWLSLTMSNGAQQIGFPGLPPTAELDVLDDGRNAIVSDPLIAQAMLAKVDTHVWARPFRVGRTLLSPMGFDGGMWDGKPFYNNPSYPGGLKTRRTPAGGHFGDPDNDDTPLGDLIIHKGTILNARDMGGGTPTTHTILRREFQFSGFGSLVADMATVGITVNPDAGSHAFTLESDGSGTGGGVIIGLSCNFVLGLLGKAAELINTPVTFPAMQGIPVAVSGLEDVESSADYEAFNESDYTDHHTETVTWLNKRRNVTEVTTRKFNLFETIGDLKEALLDPDLYTGNDAFPNTLEILMTAWGPLLHYNQIIGMDFPIVDLDQGLNPATAAFQFAVFPADGDFGWTYQNEQFLPLGRKDLFYDGTDDAGYGWPRMGLQTDAASSPVGLEYGTPAIHWPRFWRYWANARFVKREMTEQPFWVPHYDDLGNVLDPYYTVQHPLVKEWWESKPIQDSKLLGVAGTKLKKSISLLGPYSRTFDVFTRLASWYNQKSLSWKSAGTLGDGPVATSSEDFSLSTVQSQWFVDFNSAGFAETAPADLNGITQNQLPIEIEHYNAAASVVNGVTSANASELQPMVGAPLLEFFLMGSGRTPGLGIFGSAINLRPYRQWVSWDHSINPEVTAKFEAWGVPIKTRADFPASMDDFLAASTLFSDGLGTINDDGMAGSLYGYWQANLFHANPATTLSTFQGFLNAYRWVTIEDAIELHERLGFPFVFYEVCTPCNLLIIDADWEEIDMRADTVHGAVSPTEQDPVADLISRGAALVNKHGLAGEFDSETAGDAEWVHDPYASAESIGPRIRRDLTAPRYSLNIMTEIHSVATGPTWDVTTTDHLVRAIWGTAPLSIENKIRNYDDGPLSNNATTTTYPADAEPAAERCYFVRRYGCAPCRVILWPRNYADFQLHFDHSFAQWAFSTTAEPPEDKWGHVPRVVRNIEGGTDPVIDEQGMTTEEFLVVAPVGFENGEMQVYWAPRPLT